MRGHYRNELLVGATPGDQVHWGKWIAIGAVVIGGYVLIVRPALKKKVRSDGQSAYWDTFAAKHRQ